MIHRVRLFTGLVLFTYVTTHLLNHSLGMVSLQAAEAGRLWFVGFWRFPLATWLLYGSLVTHIVLALWAIFQRRHLRLPAWEIIRLVLGLLIPLMLIPHVFATRVSHEVLGVADTYARQILIYWVLNPLLGLQQLTLLVVAWVHGWLGLYHWLKVTTHRPATLTAFQLVGLFVPMFAVLGFLDLGREVATLSTNPAWVQRVYPQAAGTAGYGAPAADPYGYGTAGAGSGSDDYGSSSYGYYGLGAYGAPPATIGGSQAAPNLEGWKVGTWAFFVGAVAFTFLARPLRGLWLRRRGLIRLTYPDGRRVSVLPGTTILEASRAAGIPHASLCGGRGRCSTCRTRIGAGLQSLPPPAPAEARVLKRIDAPPNVRLACQVRPTIDLDVFPLLPPLAGLPPDLLEADYSGGTEREIAVLFSDMRSFTHFAESRLPYDVVFLLNQYTDAMGRAIESAGGYPNQFVGDGIMALFGANSEPVEGCRAALAGAVSMARALESLNRVLALDLKEPLRIGIGIHAGQVIVGEMGYGRARYRTAIGDVVNTASRLEGLTKEYDCQLVVSEDVASRAGVDLSHFPCFDIQVRGRSSLLQVRVIPSALDLAPLLEAAVPQPA